MKTIAESNDRREPEAELPGRMPEPYRVKAKFISYGEEMIHKQVKQSGASGRIYLPTEWVGKNVKIIRLD